MLYAFSTLLLLNLFYLSYSFSFKSINTKINFILNSLPIYDEAPVIIGGGPVGLTSAILLARLGAKSVYVYEQLPRPPKPSESYWEKFRSERSYNIGITGRGQIVLNKFGCLGRVEKYCAEIFGSASWNPDTPTDSPILMKQEKRYTSKIIERDRLTGGLLEEIDENYSNVIHVMHDARCKDITWRKIGKSDEYCTLKMEISSQETDSTKPNIYNVNTTFLIGADGSNSVVRNAIMAYDPNFKSVQYQEINEYVYRTVPINFPRIDDFCPKGKELTYSVRIKEGINLESLPTKEGIHLGVILFKPGNEIMKNITSIETARYFLFKYFPMVAPHVTEEGLLKLATSKISRFQRFQYVYPKLHFSQSACLLGDAIHTVKPYFGMGVNSGLEDVSVLADILESKDINRKEIFSKFSEIRAKEAKALVQLSQRLDRGFIYFILPLIIDRFFHKLCPNIFENTVLSCFQDERRSFTWTARRKALDRVLQGTIIGIFLSFFSVGVFALMKKIIFLIGKFWLRRVSIF